MKKERTSTTYRAAAVVAGSLIVVGLLTTLCFATVHAMLSPAEVYCEALGYEVVVESTELGERVLCRLPDDQTVDAWDFLSGKVALEWSYCAQQGYEARHVEDSEVCAECTVCVLPDGSEVEVTQLMGLTFDETTCGDGTCGFPEDYGTCPEDCPSGGWDEYCDGVSDGICDPDCDGFSDGICDPDCEQDADPDCAARSTGVNWPLIGGIIAAVVVVAAISIYLVARRKPAPAR